jgi:hypothetical protein
MVIPVPGSNDPAKSPCSRDSVEVTGTIFELDDEFLFFHEL